MLRNLLLASVLGLGLGAFAPVQADSCPSPCYTYRWVTEYKHVTCYETRTVAYTKYCTRYDECNRPYQVAQVCYREVQVPVTRTVAVRRKVLVCD